LKSVMLVLVMVAWACAGGGSGRSSVDQHPGRGTQEAAHEEPGDLDDDTVPDSNDSCPEDPEDFDGHMDEDGCPDCDHDVQWIMCFYDETGGSCPGATMDDHDGDGIGNDHDTCSGLPEDRDAFEDDDGCPEPDNDFDCIFDASDKCPNSPGPESSGGCPAQAMPGH
jgi:hypothetical protein